jgi:hypothetical protein
MTFNKLMEPITLNRLFKKDSLTTIAKIYIPGVLLLTVLAVFSLMNDFHFSDLSRDPIQILNAKPYIGLLSRIGIVIMCSTAAILIFESLLLSQKDGSGDHFRFFLLSGLLSFFLMCDDFFLLHDVIFPEYLHINENFLYVFYGFSFVALMYFFRRILLNSDYVLLILSVGFLGISVFVDVIIVMGFDNRYSMVFEDMAKFMGLFSWSCYFLRTGWKIVSPLSLENL